MMMVMIRIKVVRDGFTVTTAADDDGGDNTDDSEDDHQMMIMIRTGTDAQLYDMWGLSGSTQKR